jgi:hypothetical protein
MLDLAWTEEPRGRTEISEAATPSLESGLVQPPLEPPLQGGKTAPSRSSSVETDADRKGSRERTVQRNIWEGALAAAKRVEKEFGKENLGPWTDFEWGMINGKLSALNWVMGEEWDMLDT